jgi:hypothetical protein
MTDQEPQSQDHQEGMLQALAEEQDEEQDRQHQELIAALQRELGLID